MIQFTPGEILDGGVPQQDQTISMGISQNAQRLAEDNWGS